MVAALKNVQREEQAFARASQRAREASRGGLGGAAGGRGGILGRIGSTELAAGAGGVAMGLGLPAVGAAFLAGMTAAGAVKAGSHLQTQQIRMTTAGIAPGEISAADLQAIELTKKYPTVSRAEIDKIYRETRASLVHPEETKELLELS